MRKCIPLSFNDTHHLLALTLAELFREKKGWKQEKEKKELSEKMPCIAPPNHISQCY